MDVHCSDPPCYAMTTISLNMIAIGIGTGGTRGPWPPRFQKMNFGPHSFGKVRGIACNDLYGMENAKMHAKLLLLKESKNGLVFYWFQAPLIFVE